MRTEAARGCCLPPFLPGSLFSCLLLNQEEQRTPGRAGKKGIMLSFWGGSEHQLPAFVGSHCQQPGCHSPAAGTGAGGRRSRGCSGAVPARRRAKPGVAAPSAARPGHGSRQPSLKVTQRRVLPGKEQSRSDKSGGISEWSCFHACLAPTDSCVDDISAVAISASEMAGAAVG